MDILIYQRFHHSKSIKTRFVLFFKSCVSAAYVSSSSDRGSKRCSSTFFSCSEPSVSSLWFCDRGPISGSSPVSRHNKSVNRVPFSLNVYSSCKYQGEFNDVCDVTSSTDLLCVLKTCWRLWTLQPSLTKAGALLEDLSPIVSSECFRLWRECVDMGQA